MLIVVANMLIAVAGRKNFGGKRRVGEPSYIGCGAGGVESAASDEAVVQQQPAEARDPEAECIEARKRHIARTDHQGDQVIAEAEENRDTDEEDHRRAVHGEEAVEDLGREKAVIRNGKLDAHQERFEARNDEEDQSVGDVHQADLLMIDGGEPVVQHLEHRRLRAGRRRFLHLFRYWSGCICHRHAALLSPGASGAL
jgi:hypothetical protein